MMQDDMVLDLISWMQSAGNDVHSHRLAPGFPRLISINNGPELTEAQFVEVASDMLNDAAGLPHY